MRIAILGAGGVGATVAGALAKQPDIELILIARGQTKENVQKNGWILESEQLGNQIIQPALVSDDVQEIGVVDVLLLCCKSFAVQEVCQTYGDVVDAHTLVIPLQNGFCAAEQAREAVQKGQVAHGFIYCLSNIVEKGHVQNVGKLLRAGFGFPDGRENETAAKLAQYLQNGGLLTVYTTDILRLIWEKYMMICGNSCAFLYYDCTAGGIMAEESRMAFLKGAYEDIARLANAIGVSLSEGIVDKYLQEFRETPPGSMSSLYRDIKAKSPENELEQIVGNAVRLGREKGVGLPFVAAAYDKTIQTML